MYFTQKSHRRPALRDSPSRRSDMSSMRRPPYAHPRAALAKNKTLSLSLSTAHARYRNFGTAEEGEEDGAQG